MVITLKNIGTIEQASFDLDKDLIVFIGPNNSGKTYASYCLYGLEKFNMRLKATFVNSIFQDSLDELFINGTIELDLPKIFTKEKVQLIFEKFSSSLKDFLPKLFAFNKDYFEKSEIQFSYKSDSDLIKYLNDFIFPLSSSDNGKRITRYTKRPNSTILKIDINYNDQSDRDKAIPEVDGFYIKQSIIEHAFKPLYPVWEAYFIPAERIGISVFSKDVFSRRFTKTNEILAINTSNETGKIELLQSEFNAYSLIIQDALKNYGDLSSATERLYPNESIENLANELEEKILKGKISNSKSGDIYYSSSNKFQMKINGAGSIIKSLTSLLLYLRYEAMPGQLLIIDEPEINLHPDNQRLVARILAKLSKLGVKVIVSTHSDYFIRELNNLIMLNKEHPETVKMREKYGYEESEILDYKRVGVYLFKDNKATELEVTAAGMEAATIDEEINKLNNTATDIYWTLFED